MTSMSGVLAINCSLDFFFDLSEHGGSAVVLRQLRQLSLAQVCRQRPPAALPHHGQVQPEAHVDRLHVQGLLHQYPESSLLRILHAGDECIDKCLY